MDKLILTDELYNVFHSRLFKRLYRKLARMENISVYMVPMLGRF